MRKLVAALMVCFAVTAKAQTTSMDLDSIWAPWAATTIITGMSIQPQQLDAQGGLHQIGPIVAMPQFGFGTSVFQAVIPVLSATTTMRVDGLIVFFHSSGSFWTMQGTIQVLLAAKDANGVQAQKPIILPAGGTLAVRYDAPKLSRGQLQTAINATTIGAPQGSTPFLNFCIGVCTP